MHATSEHGFALDIEAEIAKIEWCDLIDLAVPLVVVQRAGRAEGMGRPGVCHGPGIRRRPDLRKGCLPRQARHAIAHHRRPGSLSTCQRALTGTWPAVLRPIHRGILEFVGFEVLAPQIAYGPARMTDEERRACLEAWAARLGRSPTSRRLRSDATDCSESWPHSRNLNNIFCYLCIIISCEYDDMTSRERVLAALNHEEPDQIPIIMGASNTTGMKMRPYRRLKESLHIQAPDDYLYDWPELGTARVDEETLRRLNSDVRGLQDRFPRMGI